MKKITLLLIGLLLPFSMMSQGWSEDFESVSVDGFGSVVWPEGWAAFNGPMDSGTNEWTTSTEDASGGSVSAYIQYEPLGAGMSQDFLVTPQFTPSVEEASIFSFAHMKSYTTVYPTDYSVKITTGAQNDFESYVDLIAFGAGDLTAAFEVLSLDIPAEYYGIPVHVAFVHENNDGDDWFIDDVFVYGAGTHDLAIDISTSTEFTMMPANQASPIATAANVVNLGAVTDNGAAVLMQVTDDAGDELYSETQSIDSAAGEVTTVSFSGYTPIAPGAHYVSATVYTGGDVPDDLDATNNELTGTVFVTNGTFARDTALFSMEGTGSLGIGAGNLGYVGSTYSVNSPENVTSVTFGILNANGVLDGASVRAAIFETSVTGSPQFTPVAYTEYVTVSGLQSLYTAAIEGGSVAVDGDFVVAVEEDGANLPEGASVQASSTAGIYTPGTQWVWWETIPNDLGQWQNAEEFGYELAYVLRPNFNGNTFSTEEVISFEMSHSYDLESKVLTINSQEMLKRVNIYNMLGQEVMSNDVEGMNVNMNLSELNSSIYIVNVEGVNNTSNTFKIIVK